jgi:DNA-binding protein
MENYMKKDKYGFRKLIETTDKNCRDELDEYYIISKSRMDNIIHCLESGAKEINNTYAEVLRLKKQLSEERKEKESLQEWKNTITEAPVEVKETVRDRMLQSHEIEPIVRAWKRENDKLREELEKERQYCIKGYKEWYDKVIAVEKQLAEEKQKVKILMDQN